MRLFNDAISSETWDYNYWSEENNSWSIMSIDFIFDNHSYNADICKFYTSMNLHYSQTASALILTDDMSYTSMNLHYSQTNKLPHIFMKLSYTSMNLHYSQTALQAPNPCRSLIPLWIYITLKPPSPLSLPHSVLYLYEFTLLSNFNDDTVLPIMSYTSMNLHYSQTGNWLWGDKCRSYTSMNLHYSQT